MRVQESEIPWLTEEELRHGCFLTMEQVLLNESKDPETHGMQYPERLAKPEVISSPGFSEHWESAMIESVRIALEQWQKVSSFSQSEYAGRRGYDGDGGITIQ
jgi:hypothetical protein